MAEPMALPITPTPTALARLRVITAASAFPTLDDPTLTLALQDYAIIDSNGVIPGETGWVESFDWDGAAAECWGWKEGLASDSVNFAADGRQGSLSDIAEHCRMKKAEYQARRQTGTISTGANS